MAATLSVLGTSDAAVASPAALLGERTRAAAAGAPAGPLEDAFLVRLVDLARRRLAALLDEFAGRNDPLDPALLAAMAAYLRTDAVVGVVAADQLRRRSAGACR